MGRVSGTTGYRRRIELVTVSPEVVQGELEDDFHHFRVRITHDGTEGDGARGHGRPPSLVDLSRRALAPLQSLVGAPVTADATAHGTHGDARTSCTHWFDLTGLAIAQAGSGRVRRRYDMTVPDRGEGGRTTAHLSRDGEAVLDWEVDTQTILDPEPFTGQAMGRGFLAWANGRFDPETAEAVIALRRACRISLGRLMDLDDYDTADEVGHGMENTCHTFSTGVMATAVRMKGSSRR